MNNHLIELVKRGAVVVNDAPDRLVELLEVLPCSDDPSDFLHDWPFVSFEGVLGRWSIVLHESEPRKMLIPAISLKAILDGDIGLLRKTEPVVIGSLTGLQLAVSNLQEIVADANERIEHLNATIKQSRRRIWRELDSYNERVLYILEDANCPLTFRQMADIHNRYNEETGIPDEVTGEYLSRAVAHLHRTDQIKQVMPKLWVRS